MIRKSVVLILLLSCAYAYANNAWHENGNLHNANAIEWANSDYKNKLATSADWIATFYMNDKLTYKATSKLDFSNIGKTSNVDAIKPLCEELVIKIDDTIKGAKDSKNTSMYINQQVSNIAVANMILMGWLNE